MLRKVHRKARVVVDEQAGKVRCPEEVHYAPAGDAAAAAPVQDGSTGLTAGGVTRRGRPLAQLQFAQHGVPFPADAFPVGEVVALEIGDRMPVWSGGLVAGEEGLAQPVEDFPVE